MTCVVYRTAVADPGGVPLGPVHPPSAHSVQFFGGMTYALHVAWGAIEPPLGHLS